MRSVKAFIPMKRGNGRESQINLVSSELLSPSFSGSIFFEADLESCVSFTRLRNVLSLES